MSCFSAHNNLVLSLSTATMAESTRSKTRMERIEEAIAKLASNQLHVTTKLDELIQRITVLETSQHHSPTPPSSSSAKALLAHTPMPTPPPRPALMPQHPAPLPAPLIIAAAHLPDNSKPQASFPSRRWAAIHRVCTEFPSHHILFSDLGLSPSVTFIAKVKDKELDTAKWLRFCNTNLHSRTSYFPSSILICTTTKVFFLRLEF